jgi:hypothetical protein
MNRWNGEIFGVSLREIRGARVSVSCPFSEALLNRLIATHLPQGAAVTSVVVECHEGDRATARIVLRTSLVPPLTVKTWIDQQPDPAQSLPLVLGWSVVELGRAGLLAGVALKRLVGLPPWIRLDLDAVSIDVVALLAEGGYEELVPHISSLHISIVPGRLIAELELRA